jgi:hypothetical protein
MLTVTCADQVLLMLIVEKRIFMSSVVILNVVMLSALTKTS